MVFIRSTILPRTLLRGLIAFLTTSSSVGVRPGQKGLTAFALKHWATPPCDTFLNRRLGRDQRCRGLFDGPAYGIPSLASEWPRRSTLPSQERTAFSILQPCVRSTLVATSASGELSGESGEESDALLLRMSFESVEAEDLREWIRRCLCCVQKYGFDFKCRARARYCTTTEEVLVVQFALSDRHHRGPENCEKSLRCRLVALSRTHSSLEDCVILEVD